MFIIALFEIKNPLLEAPKSKRFIEIDPKLRFILFGLPEHQLTSKFILEKLTKIFRENYYGNYEDFLLASSAIKSSLPTNVVADTDILFI